MSVKNEFRTGRVFLGLAQFLARYCLKKGYQAAIISGTVRQLKLYGQMGFTPFAHLVGSDDALYQPMYLTKETFQASVAGRILRPIRNFLPGPVPIAEKVRKALSQEPISHRSEPFIETMNQVKRSLCTMTNASNVQILVGSGTLANDVIAAQLSLLEGRGLILINGEFGTRLRDQAERMGLDFDVVNMTMGQPFCKEELLQSVNETTKWIWAVHSETSTGMLNDLTLLKEIAKVKQLHFCVDCISSIGAVPIDLNGVYLASGVSGKALSAFTGLSFVFHQHSVKPSKKLAKYLDLGIYAENDSIPFSHSSNLLDALWMSLSLFTNDRFQKIRSTYLLMRERVEKIGLSIVSSDQHASPTIITIVIPSNISSVEVGEILYYQGYQLHYESEYLRKNNWIQIACIGDHPIAEVEKMLILLEKLLF